MAVALVGGAALGALTASLSSEETVVVAAASVLATQIVLGLIFWPRRDADYSPLVVVVGSANGFALGVTVMQFLNLEEGADRAWLILGCALAFVVAVVMGVALVDGFGRLSKKIASSNRPAPDGVSDP